MRCGLVFTASFADTTDGSAAAGSAFAAIAGPATPGNTRRTKANNNVTAKNPFKYCFFVSFIKNIPFKVQRYKYYS